MDDMRDEIEALIVALLVDLEIEAADEIEFDEPSSFDVEALERIVSR